jgi:chromosome segregation ATPase
LKHRHRHELNDQRARFEGVLGRIKIVVAKRDQEIKRLDKARSNLAGRYDGLVKSVGALESAQQQMQAKVDSRTRLIELLESQLRAERETAERKIDESNAELQRVRSEHAVAERALEEICKDIALLLPELAVRRSRIGKPRFEVATSHMKAA